MKKTEIYICDCDHADVKQEENIFRKAGLEFQWLHCRNQQEVINSCQGARIFLNQYIIMDRNIFRAIPTLKCIVRYGVGVDNVNLEDADEYGVQVCNVPDYGVNEVSNHAIALMMALVRKIRQADENIRHGIWDYRQSIPVYRAEAQTVGVIGTGRIGSAFVRKARALGYRVIGYDINYDPNSGRFPNIEFMPFDRLLTESDIISVHCQLNETTRHMFGYKAFQKMKRNAYLINTARGAIVDERALDQALTEHWIAGAGIDVVEEESIPADHFLLQHDNLIVTPHMAWYSEESALELNRKCAQEAVRFMRGEALLYPVNRVWNCGHKVGK